MVVRDSIAVGRAAAEAMSSLKLKTATDACRVSVVLTSRVMASASSLCTPISTTSTTSRRSCVIISVYIVFRGCLLIYNDTRFRWWAISFSCWPYLFLSMFYIMSSHIGVDNGVYLNLNLRGSFPIIRVKRLDIYHYRSMVFTKYLSNCSRRTTSCPINQCHPMTSCHSILLS